MRRRSLPAERTGWHRAARFFVDVVWAGLPPLFVIPTGLLMLLAARQWQRDCAAQEAGGPCQIAQAPDGAAPAPSNDCHSPPSAAPIVRS